MKNDRVDFRNVRGFHGTDTNRCAIVGVGYGGEEANMNILITGGAGFIGSHFVRHYLSRHPRHKIVNLDLLTYAGRRERLMDIWHLPNHLFIEGDIRHADHVEAIFKEHQIDRVVNLAAESHVDRSIAGAGVFISTNVGGTQVLLETALKFWSRPDGSGGRSWREGVRFLQVSTDEVYGSLEEGLFNESSPLAPNNPYAASKAAADLMVRAYGKTHGLPAVVTRCCNNYGPGQHQEKMIPTMILKALKGERLPVYGDGLHSREWLHVADHCSALETVLMQGDAGEVYNIGSGEERTNLALVGELLQIIGGPESLIAHVADRPGHDRRYALDSTKIRAQLNWAPQRGFAEGLMETVAWHQDHPADAIR